MTYYINIWQSNQRPSDEPDAQYWSTEAGAVEEIAGGSPYHYYDHTIKVEDMKATVIDLMGHAEEYQQEQRAEAKWENERAPSWV